MFLPWEAQEPEKATANQVGVMVHSCMANSTAKQIWLETVQELLDTKVGVHSICLPNCKSERDVRNSQPNNRSQ